MKTMLKSAIKPSMFSSAQQQEALYYYFFDKQRKKAAIDKYKKTEIGKMRQKKASMRYYYKKNDFYHPFIYTEGNREMKYNKNTNYKLDDFPEYCRL
jgi:hypothetical protein